MAVAASYLKEVVIDPILPIVEEIRAKVPE